MPLPAFLQLPAVTDERQSILDRCLREQPTDGHPVYGGSGVYFLMKGDSLVYIGKATNVAKRIASHTGKKDFDSFRFFQCELRVLDWLEAELIKRFQPPLNVTHVPGRAPKKYPREPRVFTKEHPKGIPLCLLPEKQQRKIRLQWVNDELLRLSPNS